MLKQCHIPYFTNSDGPPKDDKSELKKNVNGLCRYLDTQRDFGK